jgi:hypothetical protein
VLCVLRVLRVLRALRVWWGQLLARSMPARPRLCGVLAWLTAGPVAVAVVVAVLLVVVLPSFFTLLIFRTAYIEVEATKFLERQVPRPSRLFMRRLGAAFS